MATPFTPKQFLPFTMDWYMASSGAAAHDAVATAIFHHIPPLEAHARVLDNLAGPGPVTKAAVQSCSAEIRATLQVDAVDLAPPFMDYLEKQSAQHGWRVKTHIMDAQSLEFPDATFTHSVTAFGFPMLADPVLGVREVYRTLKPGGIAATAFWRRQPIGESLNAMADRVRGLGHEQAVRPEKGWNDPDAMKAQLASGGFDPQKIELIERSFHHDVTREELVRYWGFIGLPKEGWKNTDEEQWDEIVDGAFEMIRTSEGCQAMDDTKCLSFEVPAMIAFVTK